MTDLFLLAAAQCAVSEPYFPLSHGIARVDDRRMISRIVFVIETDFAGVMRRLSMARIRRSIIGLCAGVSRRLRQNLR